MIELRELPDYNRLERFHDQIMQDLKDELVELNDTVHDPQEMSYDDLIQAYGARAGLGMTRNNREGARLMDIHYSIHDLQRAVDKYNQDEEDAMAKAGLQRALADAKSLVDA